jgi:hypothetical protein
MTTTCKKCGTPASQDQAFCAKCGAVIGMEGPNRPAQAPPNMARTIAIKDFKLPQLPKKAKPPTRDAGHKAGTANENSNSLLFVLLGFLAVLVIGGLILLLVYFLL